MALPADARSHHTVWLRDGNERAVAVRYAVAGDRLVCFGDEGLASVRAGRRVSATVHAIACGPPLVTFDATVREIAPDEVDIVTVSELLANVMDGDGTVDGAVRWLDEQRRRRRMVELVP